MQDKKINIQIENLYKSVKTGEHTKVLFNNLHLNVYEGEFISLVGKSGIGKTTLLNVISGIEKEFSGKLKVSKKINYVTQEPFLLNFRDVYENIILPIEIEKRSINNERVLDLLSEFDVEKFINSYPEELSGGMKQKVCLIRALVSNNKIFLLDESFSAIDHKGREEQIQKFRDLVKKENGTVVYVTHNLEEAVRISDRILLLKDGVLTEFGSETKNTIWQNI